MSRHQCGAGAPGNINNADQNSWSRPADTRGDSLPSVHGQSDHKPGRPGDLLNEVTDYLENVLVPYYQSNLSKLAVTSQSKQLTVQLDVVNGATCTLVKSTELAMRKEAMAEFLVVSVVVDRVKKLGGKVNKTVRINGRPTKCLTLPKTVFSRKTGKI